MERRTKAVTIMVTPTEHTRLTEAAWRLRLSVSELIRQAVFKEKANDRARKART